METHHRFKSYRGREERNKRQEILGRTYFSSNALICMISLTGTVE
jgi:hypothetical protein